MFINVSIFLIFSSKFKDIFSFSLFENHIPKVLKTLVLYLSFFRFCGSAIFLPTFLPIGNISVLSKLSLRPEKSEKNLNSAILLLTDSKLERNKVVSSANCAILKVVLHSVIPWMSLFCLIQIARISATKMNKRADMGQPCLTDLEILKDSE